MSAAFLGAARSYYGLADQPIRKSEAFTDGTETVVVFEFVVSDDDLIGVLERMKTMRVEQPAQEMIDPPTVGLPLLQLRCEYDAMTPTQKSQFGSFARFVASSAVASDAAYLGGLPG